MNPAELSRETHVRNQKQRTHRQPPRAAQVDLHHTDRAGLH